MFRFSDITLGFHVMLSLKLIVISVATCSFLLKIFCTPPSIWLIYTQNNACQNYSLEAHITFMKL